MSSESREIFRLNPYLRWVITNPWLIVIAIAAVFTVELLIMIMLRFWLSLSPVAEIIVDVVLLITVIFVPLLLFIRPHVKSIDLEQRRQAERLRRSERKYRAYIENSPVGIFVIDESGRYVEVNPAACQMTGYSRTELLGMSVTDLAYEPREPASTEAFTRAVKEPGGSREIEIRHKNGERRCFLISSVPLEEHRAIGFCEDITALKTAEEERASLQNAVQAERDNLENIVFGIRGGLIVVDDHSQVIWSNNIMQEWFGTGSEILGRDCCDILQYDTAIEECAIKLVLKGQTAATSEHDATTSDGEIRCFLITANAIPHGDERRALVLVQDVTTARAIAEEKNRLFRELEESHANIEQLLHIASHDLRAPLVSIKGFHDLLKGDMKRAFAELPDSPESAEMKEAVPGYMGYIDNALAQVNELMDGLVEMSRLGKVDLICGPVDMVHLINEVQDSLAYQIKEHEAKLLVEPLPSCQGDAVLLRLVLSNLIDNALKYRHPDRTPQITFSGQSRGEYVEYCIADNGLGVAPNVQQLVFRLFHRLNPKVGTGSGLGLSSAERIVRRHGGRMWLESEPGVGSRFYFTLPA